MFSRTPAYCFELSEECFLLSLSSSSQGLRLLQSLKKSQVTTPNQVSTNKNLSSVFYLLSLTLSYTYDSSLSLSLSLSCMAFLYSNKPRLKPLVCRARLINPRILCSCFVSKAYFVENWNLSTIGCFYRLHCRHLIYLMLYEYL